MSWHLTIRSDESYTGSVTAGPLMAFLASIPSFQLDGGLSFRAAPGEPWVCVILAECNSLGCYAVDAFAARINVVELVGSDFEDESWYDRLAIRIAAHLGWEVVEEDAGRRVWPRE